MDAGPMNASNDAIILGGLSDGVVLMLKAHSSRRETARKAVQELQSANVRTLGAVLNQRTFPIPEKLYKRL
jgi:Mrp family chromosome partitioning ATPase